MRAVEAPHDVAVDHVNRRLGGAAVDGFDGMHAFLDDHFGDGQSFFHDGHLVSLFAIEIFHFGGIANGHDAHAVSAGIGLDDDEGLRLDAVFAVPGARAGQYGIHLGGQTVLPGPFPEIDPIADGEIRIDQPGIDTDGCGETAGDFPEGREVIGFAPRRPAGMERRNDRLFVQIFQDVRNPGRQIVVEQDGVRVEIPEYQATPLGAGAQQGLQHQALAIGKGNRRRGRDLGQQAADAHVEARPSQNHGQLQHVLQIERVASVALRNQEQLAGTRAVLLDGRHDGRRA